MEKKRGPFRTCYWVKVCLCFVGLLCVGQTEAVFAATLPDGLIIGDQNGVYVKDDGDYFIQLENVLPGAVYTKEITLRNTDEQEPFELGVLVSEEASQGPIAFGEHLTMTLVLDDRLLYEGPLLGDGSSDWAKTPLSFGKMTYGTDKIVTATFKVDATLTNKEYQEASEYRFKWTFVATRKGRTTASSPEPPDPKPTPPFKGWLPQTGEEWRKALYTILVGLFLLLLGLLLWKKQRQEEGAAGEAEKASHQRKGADDT